MASPLTTLVGENLGEGYYKWSDSVYCNGNHHVYGIPLTANRDLKFNPTDKSSAPIEPDLGDRYKYDGGTEDEKGCIYCTPHDCWNTRGMLKIETNTDNVTILDARPPEEEEGQHNTGTGRYFKWTKGALGLDGNIYFMPMDFASPILKLNTDTDTFESVGDELGEGQYSGRYCWAVRCIDGCIYGIPNMSNHIVKYDPVSQVTSCVGKKHTRHFNFGGNGQRWVYLRAQQAR